MKIFIIIPAFNEEKKIGDVVSSLFESGYQNIIVVDDGSSDRTFDVAKNSGAMVISHCVNRGQGSALRSGTEYALRKSADVIVHFDADGQMRVDDIDKLIKALLENKHDVVLGSRFLEVKSEMPALRKFVLFLARFFNRFFLGIRIKDPSSGFRALTAESAKRLVIKHDRMAHCSQLLADMFRFGLSVGEVPVRIIYSEYSIRKGQRGVDGFKVVWELLFRKLWDM